jgi:hypothetical protein
MVSSLVEPKLSIPDGRFIPLLPLTRAYGFIFNGRNINSNRAYQYIAHG